MSVTRTAAGGTRATVSRKADRETLDRITGKLRAAIGAGVIDLDIAEAPAKSTDSGPAKDKGPGKDGLVH